jgi:hypothetical protein
MKDFTQWSFFKNRRNVNLSELIKKNGMKEYSDFERWCIQKRILCGSPEEFKLAYDEAYPAPPEKPKTVTTKRSTRRKKKETSSISKTKQST